MLEWYGHLSRKYGFLAATSLYLRTALDRAHAAAINSIGRSRFECPCCGWEGRRWLDYIEVGYTVPRSQCPRCGSHSRHRALALWMRERQQTSPVKGRMLIVAPESCFDDLWTAMRDVSSVRVDLNRRDVDLVASVCALPLRRNVIDFVWCHHVLEHIQEDRVAIGEVFRVLKSGGAFVVSVPMTDRAATLEYGYPNPRDSDHWRIYGADFADRLSNAGFGVQPIRPSLPPEVHTRYGIRVEPLFLCSKGAS